MRDDHLRILLEGMKAAHARGENAMAWARRELNLDTNQITATLIAYDLQAGGYIEEAKRDPSVERQRCETMAQILAPWVKEGDLIMEAGCGEATTLAGTLLVLSQREGLRVDAAGFDVSWSRVAHGLAWLRQKRIGAYLFVADLFAAPLASNSVDVVYTSHSLEPNGGREEEAIRELLRVSRRAVILVEPAYEFASEAGRRRMAGHGYVRGLRDAAECVEAEIMDYRPVEYSSNPLNPSGLLVLRKKQNDQDDHAGQSLRWRCPISRTPLHDLGDVFFASEVGLAYPILRKVPLLRPENAVVANAIPLTDRT